MEILRIFDVSADERDYPSVAFSRRAKRAVHRRIARDPTSNPRRGYIESPSGDTSMHANVDVNPSDFRCVFDSMYLRFDVSADERDYPSVAFSRRAKRAVHRRIARDPTSNPRRGYIESPSGDTSMHANVDVNPSDFRCVFDSMYLRFDVPQRAQVVSRREGFISHRIAVRRTIDDF